MDNPRDLLWIAGGIAGGAAGLLLWWGIGVSLLDISGWQSAFGYLGFFSVTAIFGAGIAASRQ